jgi:P-type Cu+ transporter
MEHQHARHSHIEDAKASGGSAIDPVCGMTVKIQTAKYISEYKSKDYYFCSAGCKTKFIANPIKYLDASAKEAMPVIAGAIYTCPMHPQIQQVGPGSCPICGMAVEPLVVTADSGPNHELADMTRRLWIGAALALPVLILAMAGGMLGITK